ncbi:MAG: TonB C-terminal domain-containing protein [Propionivibrio sp.]|nr:TonB C-terminal domain-containing protein [Propionivibrio sp.]
MPPPEKSNLTSLILAALVHVLLIGALFLGVQWKSHAPASVAVEVWRAAPAPMRDVKPEPTPKPPPKPEPTPEPKPEPKPAPKPEPTPPIKPDIAIKEDKKPKKEEPKKPEPKKEETKKAEPKKPEPDRRPSFDEELQRDLKQAQQRKAAQDQRARADAESRMLAQLKEAEAAAAYSRGLADYTSKVAGKIRGNIVLPPGIQGNPEAEFAVTQLPSGDVIDVRVRKSSGNPTLDAAIERAIRKSSPLPKPDNPALFERVLRIPYHPFEQ